MAGIADDVGVFNVVILSTFLSAGLQASIYGATTDTSAAVISFFMASWRQVSIDDGPDIFQLSNTVLEIGHRMGFRILHRRDWHADLITDSGSLAGQEPDDVYMVEATCILRALSVVGTCFLAVSRLLLIKRTEATKKFMGLVRT